jgi:hypothetical protein
MGQMLLNNSCWKIKRAHKMMKWVMIGFLGRNESRQVGLRERRRSARDAGATTEVG